MCGVWCAGSAEERKDGPEEGGMEWRMHRREGERVRRREGESERGKR